jgi:hypothetical protein
MNLIDKMAIAINPCDSHHIVVAFAFVVAAVALIVAVTFVAAIIVTFVVAVVATCYHV